MSHKILSVSEEDNDTRVDVYITRTLGETVPSRMFIKRLIDAGRVSLKGKIIKAQYKVQAGDQIDIDIAPEDYPDERIKPEAIPLDILYEDDEIIAINKPIAMTVHPASGNYGGTLVNALVHHFGTLSDVNGVRRPGIVHRLDRETSGVILVAKTNMAHARLAKQFETHTIEKKYVALVEGEVQFDEGVVEASIGRHPKYHDMRCIVPKGDGKAAVTYYTVIKRSKSVTAVALFPETGRTHQLRVHMKHIGHPIMGDENYGNKGIFPRLALHAQAIFFEHPRTKSPLELSTPLPVEFLPYL
ncbi:MAG: RluA family pseudouridine synthase [Candidatus Omnitrophica bacterium]|nr:RluA family pseudouridine synthase [Candidatus Omnitrophota bacterium]